MSIYILTFHILQQPVALGRFQKLSFPSKKMKSSAATCAVHAGRWQARMQSNFQAETSQESFAQAAAYRRRVFPDPGEHMAFAPIGIIVKSAWLPRFTFLPVFDSCQTYPIVPVYPHKKNRS